MCKALEQNYVQARENRLRENREKGWRLVQTIVKWNLQLFIETQV